MCVFKRLLSILRGKWAVGGRKGLREMRGQENTAVVPAEGDGYSI